MKLIKTICCIILAAVLLGSVTANAADSYITINGFTFYINNNGDAVIYSYSGEPDVVIPEKLLNAEVVMIDDYAFFGNTDIKSVSFENAAHLNKIGINAFYGCTGLKEITIPSSVTELSFGVFQNCSGLERVKIENGITSIPGQAFLGCTSLVDVEIPDSVTSIGSGAFKNSDNVVIYCSESSYAHSYAEQQSITNEVPFEYELGDVNLDKTVNIRDVTTIQLYKVGLIEELPSYRGKTFADVTKDGKVNVRDATMIQMKLAELINKF